jgi:hypothetical protein
MNLATDPRPTFAAFALVTAAGWTAAPAVPTTAEVMLSRIVEADAAAMEANDLVSLGMIPHDRYEAAAHARDEAIEAAAEFLRQQKRTPVHHNP